MISYRYYFLDDADHIASGNYLLAVDDAEAIGLLRELAHESVCELWCGTRVIATIPTYGGEPIVRAAVQ